jgi:hypothetical protein
MYIKNGREKNNWKKVNCDAPHPQKNEKNVKASYLIMELVVADRPDPVRVVRPNGDGHLGLTDVPEPNCAVVSARRQRVLLVRVEVQTPVQCDQMRGSRLCMVVIFGDFSQFSAKR